MLTTITNQSGSALTNVSISISGGGTLTLSPASSVDSNRATTFQAEATGSNEIIAVLNFTLNGTSYSKPVGGGKPLSPSSCGLMVVTPDGHLVEIIVWF
jgi:hypothetical protein